MIDYGGVLTAPLADCHGDWCESEDLPRSTLEDLFHNWSGRSWPTGHPVHLVETGAISLAAFERILAGALTEMAGPTVEPAGLGARIISFFRPEPIMVEQVRRIRAAGLRAALLTNSWGAGRPWEAFGDIFNAVLVSRELGLRKPDPAIYAAAAAAVDCAPAECVFLDDHRGNVRAARAAGMRSLWHQDPDRTLTQLSGHFVLQIGVPLPVSAVAADPRGVPR